ncbi:hypothetical protein IMZ08_15735 [Bacillus luteolus]|uniref:Uncharacterized protein n=1 Tax=Litchfieldia luteola TaxID=682179 RepID=A0ABR9QLX1_9BACI|nr:CBO0543 family protein [Cytobacillus luteolus]MBE4909502.1 hypothetical protein [Cytobacillus luteolus]MBP1940903.1 putative membrane protein [Cytobacillus luteolus]
MHVGITIAVLLAVYWKADWKNWRHYHPTLLYVVICNLLYNCLCAGYLLWEYKPDFLFHHNSTDLVYSFIVLPGIALLFLTGYPYETKMKKQFTYISKWVVLSLIVEGIVLLFGFIVLNRGWKYWMEVPFYFTMYYLIRLHHTRPLLTYVLSIIIIVFLMNAFDVPFSVPIEKR